jgi:hypothetical protein
MAIVLDKIVDGYIIPVLFIQGLLKYNPIRRCLCGLQLLTFPSDLSSCEVRNAGRKDALL